MSAAKSLFVGSVGALTFVAQVLASNATQAAESLSEWNLPSFTSPTATPSAPHTSARAVRLAAESEQPAVAPPIPEIPAAATGDSPPATKTPATGNNPPATKTAATGNTQPASPSTKGSVDASTTKSDETVKADEKAKDDEKAKALEKLKAKYKCSTDARVLCVNSCDGSILAKHDGATASFTVKQNTTLKIQVVGLCTDVGASYAPTVTYFSDPSTVPKTGDTGHPPTNGAPNNGAPKNLAIVSPTPQVAGQLSLLISSTDRFAQVMVTRKAAPGTAPTVEFTLSNRST